MTTVEHHTIDVIAEDKGDAIELISVMVRYRIIQLIDRMNKESDGIHKPRVMRSVDDRGMAVIVEFDIGGKDFTVAIQPSSEQRERAAPADTKVH
jgi:hypothetical protein